jgi:hypothetical protein
MKFKRIVTEYDGMFAIERIAFEEWCNSVSIYSYFLTPEAMEQVKQFFPTTIIT